MNLTDNEKDILLDICFFGMSDFVKNNFYSFDEEDLEKYNIKSHYEFIERFIHIEERIEILKKYLEALSELKYGK